PASVVGVDVVIAFFVAALRLGGHMHGLTASRHRGRHHRHVLRHVGRIGQTLKGPVSRRSQAHRPLVISHGTNPPISRTLPHRRPPPNTATPLGSQPNPPRTRRPSP